MLAISTSLISSENTGVIRMYREVLPSYWRSSNCELLFKKTFVALLGDWLLFSSKNVSCRMVLRTLDVCVLGLSLILSICLYIYHILYIYLSRSIYLSIYLSATKKTIKAVPPHSLHLTSFWLCVDLEHLLEPRSLISQSLELYWRSSYPPTDLWFPTVITWRSKPQA